ncbi:MAG: tyrosine-type recombinase/integrase, partial [Campylobacterota bacterium]|nr:tyrosine-type recombinase/integrase [Campylobacterota bacterium]
VRTLLEYSKDPKYGEHLHNYLGVAFHQGMSPSEIIGLKYGDINFDSLKPTISIERSVTKSTTGKTKNKYRKRTIPIMKGAMPYIQELMSEARKKHSLWLFSNSDGSRLDDIQKVRGHRLILKDNKRLKSESGWYLLLSDTNIEYRHLKNCRHSFAVKALDNRRVKKSAIANMLGHSSTRMIDEHYAKWTEDRAMELDTDIELFGDTFGDTSRNEPFSNNKNYG